MRVSTFSLTVLLSFSFSSLCYTKPKSCHAISYKIDAWRRLGDAITTVCKTFYFSEIYNLPIYFRDFPYFDQFAISQKAKMLTPEIEKKFSKTIPINNITDIEQHIKSSEPVLFECHFLSETSPIYSITRAYPEFDSLIRAAFTPLTSIEPVAKPPAVITVALHVRKGGGFDKPLASTQEYATDDIPIKGVYLRKNNPRGSHIDIFPIQWPAGPIYIDAVRKYISKKNNFSDYLWPIKFPPDQYYIDQLKELSSMLPGKNLLVYLFTDDPNPEAIMERYSNQLKDHPRIIFSYRQKGNHHTKNILQDLFAIAQCDCLISASSSFATAAQLLGNHQILMFPVYAIAMPDKIIINIVGVISVENHGDPLTRKIAYREIRHIGSSAHTLNRH